MEFVVTLWEKCDKMSTFAEQTEVKKEYQERDKTRRETLGKYFYDISKLIFVAIVLGGVTPLYMNLENQANWTLISSGVIFTTIFAMIGNKILK